MASHRSSAPSSTQTLPTPAPSSSTTSLSSAGGEHVLLHVYVPSADSNTPSFPGFGVFHTGIELSDSGVEHCYAGGPSAPAGMSGVTQQPARQSPDVKVWHYKETIDLGRTKKNKRQVDEILRDLSKSFSARDYDFVHNNCNHFTAAVCQRLGDIKYPPHINRAARWGGFFMDNNIKDRQRKEALKREEEERKKNPFLTTKGNSLGSASSAPKSATSSTSSSAAPTKRVNPWAEPSFFPGKK